jgi:hypothetical protein
VGAIQDAMDKAIAAIPGRVPKGFAAQVRALGGRGAHPEQRLARIFGVTPRTAKGWLTGHRTTKRNRAQAQAATDAVTDLRKLRRARAAADAGGLVVEMRATLGYTGVPDHTSDQARIRRITHAMPPSIIAPLFDAYAHQDEGGMNAALAAGFGEAYFRDGNRTNHALTVEITGIDYIDIEIKE